MEKEALLSGIQEELGGTKLQLSEQTLNDYVENVVSQVGEDAEVTPEFVKSHVGFLKSLNGNLHRDVAAEVKAYKAAHSQNGSAVDETGNNSSADDHEKMPEWAKKLRDDYEALVSERDAAKAQEAKNVLLREVRKDFVARQKQAGLEVRDYFLGNAIKEIAIPDTDADVSKLSSELEKKYNQHLKAANIPVDKPKHGNHGGGNGDPSVKALFEAKKAKMKA